MLSLSSMTRSNIPSPFAPFFFMKTYSSGRTNVSLTTTALAIWILNAVFYAIVVSLVYYYAVAPSFEDQGLYVAGTTVFVGLCNSLQAKVAFFHHQWAWPHYLVMFISVGGMLLYFLMVAVSFDDYYYVAHHVYGTGLFWLFGFFFMPVVAIFIDLIGYYGKMLVMPTQEMLFREFEHAEEFNNLQMMTCLNGRTNRRPLSCEKQTNDIQLVSSAGKNEISLTGTDGSEKRRVQPFNKPLTAVDL